MYKTQENDTDYLDYEWLREYMSEMTVAQVAHYLTYIFDCGTHELLWRTVMTSPVQLGSDSILSDRPATTIRVWFWGGPPDEPDWYQGDFLTLLVDKLYYCAVRGHTDVVDKFLETLCGNETRQIEQEVAVGA